MSVPQHQIGATGHRRWLSTCWSGAPQLPQIDGSSGRSLARVEQFSSTAAWQSTGSSVGNWTPWRRQPDRRRLARVARWVVGTAVALNEARQLRSIPIRCLPRTASMGATRQPLGAQTAAGISAMASLGCNWLCRCTPQEGAGQPLRCHRTRLSPDRPARQPIVVAGGHCGAPSRPARPT